MALTSPAVATDVPKPDVSAYTTFDEVTARLDEIVEQVRDKSVTLERSLDLFDEAIALGSKAVDMVDTAEPTDAERNEASRTTDGSADE